MKMSDPKQELLNPGIETMEAMQATEAIETPVANKAPESTEAIEAAEAIETPEANEAPKAPETIEAPKAADSAESGNESAEGAECCCGRKKVRSEKEHRDLINRLNRIEGQIRGIKGMVEKDAYCIDILNQASAASSALSSFCKVLLSSHIRSCVAEDVRQGNEDKMDELVKTLQKMMR